MKRILLFLAAFPLIWFGGRALVRALASDETKIRWLLEDVASGFDRTRMDPILSSLAPDYRDETSGASRSDLREALADLFFTARDERTKGFPYRVTLRILRIEISGAPPDAPTATCELEARFADLREGKPSPAWEIAASLVLVRGPDGWRIRRSRHETKSGKLPG